MVAAQKVTYSEISPSEFFYRNRDLAGFSNPSRALYTSIRELVENSLDACEQEGILPEVTVKIAVAPDGTKAGDQVAYVITVKDNGPGIEAKHLPNAFGRVFYGSKYKLKQSRGMFGMGGTMAILYAQITTNKPVTIASSFDGKTMHVLDMLIDIQENKPVILKHDTKPATGTGTSVQLTMMGDYLRAGAKILDYFKQTALVTPYGNITLIDPDSNILTFQRATTTMPTAPSETLPHPYGIDVEALRRLIKQTQDPTLAKFMTKNFHRVGERTAEKFLKFAGFSVSDKPKSLSNEDAVRFVNALHQFDEFLAPDASCLSPLGEEIMQAGIMKELAPEFVVMCVRPPSAYSGFPFIVEVGLAYGGKNIQPGIKLLRFANRIPLLYDEANDVAFKMINEEIDWKRYRIPQDAPIAVITHVCSTKVPYKTVGKEYLADRPELERELKNAMREVLRKLSTFVSRKGSMEFQKKRFNIYAKYLPLIAKFSTELSDRKRTPDYKKLLRSQTVQDIVEEGSEEKPADAGQETPDASTEASVGNEKVKQDAQERLEKFSNSS
ncbi:MAG TPA: DNA topoisomerase VI subunit B [Nitrososphaerales archaeon]|nr:DNA topoisomerase VI subunit B [Nitrososphaerales archaeon]